MVFAGAVQLGMFPVPEVGVNPIPGVEWNQFIVEPTILALKLIGSNGVPAHAKTESTGETVGTGFTTTIAVSKTVQAPTVY